jgi:hypothetical protein
MCGSAALERTLKALRRLERVGGSTTDTERCRCRSARPLALIALGQEGVRPREDVGLCRVGVAESLPVATMHRFEDLMRWRAKLDLVFGMRVANLKELTLAALKQSTTSELHIREIVKLGHG